MNNLKKKLDEMSKNLPSPVPSPHPDAPSPDQTPEYPGNEDNTEAIDMEMSDSDNEVVPVLEASTGESQCFDQLLGLKVCENHFELAAH